MSKRVKVEQREIVANREKAGKVVGSGDLAAAIQEFLNAKELYVWPRLCRLTRVTTPKMRIWLLLIDRPCSAEGRWNNRLYSPTIKNNKALMVVRRLVREWSCIKCGDSFTIGDTWRGAKKLCRSCKRDWCEICRVFGSETFGHSHLACRIRRAEALQDH
jgi:hypothetical protein